MIINWENYAAVAFIDSNIALEALALEQLPWKELDAAGPVLVLITPTVLREVDSKKSHSRLGDHARRFNKTLRPLVSGQDSVVVRPSPPPRVDIALAEGSPVNWDEYPELDRNEPDARIIGEVLATKVPGVERRVVVSHDIRPLQLARQHGLKVHHVGENWLRPKEISEADKRAASLQRELAAIKDREPKLEISFQGPVTPVRQYRVPNLTHVERTSINRTILDLNPIPAQSRHTDPMMRSLLGSEYDHSLERRYQRYESEVVPSFVSEYERNIEKNFGQMEVIFRLKNVGKVPAHSLLINITVTGGWLNDRWFFVSPSGPSTPRVRDRSHFLHNRPNFDSRSLVPSPRHEVVINEGPKRSTNVELACTDFRHGYSYEYRMIAWRDPHAQELRIAAVATASNLHGDAQSSVIITTQIEDCPIGDLVDLETMKLKAPCEVLDLLKKAKEIEDYNQFELDGTGWDNE